MATSPYLPSAVPNPNDPMARPNVTPAPPPPTGYQNTPAGRASYLQKFAQTPWFNAQLFDSYLQSHPDWTQNTDYWDKRLGDAPGSGSNVAPAPSTKTRSPYMTDPTMDLSQAGPPKSDMLAQVMAELQAQQTGGDSPLTRQVHLRMLTGGQ
jgi:hypothetical protein